MKNNFLSLIAICLSIFSYGQNVVVNGNFQTGNLAPWLGFNNQILTDNLTNSWSGNVNHGEGSLYQTLTLKSEETYTVAFNYRWVSGTGAYDMNVRAKDENSATVFGNLVLDTLPDVWMSGTFTFTVPQGITAVRLVFYKLAGNRPLRMDNVYLATENNTSTLVDPATPVNAQPLGVSGDWDLDFSDEFNATEIDPNKWIVSVSTRSRSPRANLGVNDWWWVEENAFLDSVGHLVLRGTKVDHNTMHCGSVESRGIYEPTFGYLEARIKIAETAKGNHTAFWLQGKNQGNVDNSAADGAEIDIFESAWLANNTKAVVHFDGYGAQKKNHTIPYNTPNLHTGFHVFGLHWTADSMNIYYDGVKVQSTNQNKPFPYTVDPNGYPLVPQVPEWLWLSIGASFGDGDFQSQQVGTLSDALVDYVRVYKRPQPVGIGDETSGQLIRIYPNPAKHLIKIDSNLANYHLRIFDLNGRLITQSRHAFATEIDVSALKKGIYLFQITSEETVCTLRVTVH
jgi:hypothetical protein